MGIFNFYTHICGKEKATEVQFFLSSVKIIATVIVQKYSWNRFAWKMSPTQLSYLSPVTKAVLKNPSKRLNVCCLLIPKQQCWNPLCAVPFRHYIACFTTCRLVLEKEALALLLSIVFSVSPAGLWCRLPRWDEGRRKRSLTSIK